MAYRGGRPAASLASLHGELASVQAARAARHHPEQDPHFQLLRRALEYLHQKGACWLRGGMRCIAWAPLRPSATSWAATAPPFARPPPMQCAQAPRQSYL